MKYIVFNLSYAICSIEILNFLFYNQALIGLLKVIGKQNDLMINFYL